MNSPADITLEVGNDIPSEQIRPEFMALLRAHYRTYRDAKFTHGCFALLTISLPMISILMAPAYPLLKEYVALAALVLLLIDVGIIDSLQKDRVKKAARLQEEFDTKILRMPWRRFVSGQMVDPEDVHAASAKLLSEKREAKLMHWYEPAVGDIPLPFARLICQRTNISYDMRIRKRYACFLLYGTVFLGISLLFRGLAFHLIFSELLLTLGVPFAPLLSWALREHRKQNDTANTLANLKSEWEKLWDKALSDADAIDLEGKSRELQDAIFQHRASASLVFDWIYDLFRTTNENQARQAVLQFVAQVQKAIDEDVTK